MLADNELGAEAGVALAEALKVNSTVQNLNLGCECAAQCGALDN